MSGFVVDGKHVSYQEYVKAEVEKERRESARQWELKQTALKLVQQIGEAYPHPSTRKARVPGTPAIGPTRSFWKTIRSWPCRCPKARFPTNICTNNYAKTWERPTMRRAACM